MGDFDFGNDCFGESKCSLGAKQMMIALGLTLCFSLLLFLGVRHLVIELLALKVVVDCMVAWSLFVRGPGKQTLGAETSAWLLLSVGVLGIFLFMAAAARRQGGV
jgi:hypothetical protein